MTTITQTITPLPRAPDPATDSPDVFSATAAASVAAQRGLPNEINTWSGQLNTVAGELNAAASAATGAADAAGISATNAGTSATEALAAKNDAVAAAQAAGASAGLPALVNSSFLQVSAGGVMSWLAKTAETFWAKAVGGKLQAPAFTFVNKGTVAAAGTAAFLFSDGDTQRVQAAGALTITVGGWQPTGSRCELELQCTNFGGKTITWPSLRWIVSGGGYTTVAGSNGVTFQTAGTDYVLLWTDDGGATIYAKVLR